MDPAPILLGNIDINLNVQDQNYDHLARNLLKYRPQEKDSIKIRTKCAKYIDSVDISSMLGELVESNIHKDWHQTIDTTARIQFIHSLVSAIGFGYDMEMMMNDIEKHLKIIVNFAKAVEAYIFMNSDSYEMYYDQINKDGNTIFRHLQIYGKLPNIKSWETQKSSPDLIFDTPTERIEDGFVFVERPNDEEVKQESNVTSYFCVIS